MAAGIKGSDLVASPSPEERWGESMKDMILIPGDEIPFNQDRKFNENNPRVEIIASPRYVSFYAFILQTITYSTQVEKEHFV